MTSKKDWPEPIDMHSMPIGSLQTSLQFDSQKPKDTLAAVVKRARELAKRDGIDASATGVEVVAKCHLIQRHVDAGTPQRADASCPE